MANWIDYLPGGYLLDKANQHFFTGPANAQKAGLDQAMQTSAQGTQSLQNFYANQQGKALAFYGPLQQMYQSAYGTKGLMPPTTPRYGGT